MDFSSSILQVLNPMTYIRLLVYPFTFLTHHDSMSSADGWWRWWPPTTMLHAKSSGSHKLAAVKRSASSPELSVLMLVALVWALLEVVKLLHNVLLLTLQKEAESVEASEAAKLMYDRPSQTESNDQISCHLVSTPIMSGSKMEQEQPGGRDNLSEALRGLDPQTTKKRECICICTCREEDMLVQMEDDVRKPPHDEVVDQLPDALATPPYSPDTKSKELDPELLSPHSDQKHQRAAELDTVRFPGTKNPFLTRHKSESQLKEKQSGQHPPRSDDPDHPAYFGLSPKTQELPDLVKPKKDQDHLAQRPSSEASKRRGPFLAGSKAQFHSDDTVEAEARHYFEEKLVPGTERGPMDAF